MATSYTQCLYHGILYTQCDFSKAWMFPASKSVSLWRDLGRGISLWLVRGCTRIMYRQGCSFMWGKRIVTCDYVDAPICTKSFPSV